MQTSLKDLTKHLKGLLPIEIPETYAINPMFGKNANEEDIRNGVTAFRDFLLI